MLSNTAAWHALEAHKKKLESVPMRALFSDDTRRFDKYKLQLEGLLFDYSKHRLTDDTLPLLLQLARDADLENKRDGMFSGKAINNTENRAVLHTALRSPAENKVIVDGEDVMPFIHDTLTQMEKFTHAIHSENIITDIVNIGIGGSDLGPKMVCEALKHKAQKNISVHFVSNIDGCHITQTLKNLTPETTLFIIASKTFTTQETMTNAATAKKWFLDNGGVPEVLAKHFVALSTNESAVTDFGIAPENMFPLKDWVGGRYSLWSSIGLSICLALGFDQFKELLAGAHAMDKHFKTAPLDKNMPVIMALLGIWYRNFWDAQSYAALPYAQNLKYFVNWLQQLDMESNGKAVTKDNETITYDTGPIVFGQPGTNGQHAFYQLIHQGTALIPCDFIGIKEPICKNTERHHELLLANMIAQSQALMQGRSLEEAQNNPHKTFEGNRPSSTIIMDRLDAYHLGMLLALYEHKVFVQGIIWNINSFDQWGVELGKILAHNIVENTHNKDSLDASTQGLLKHIGT